MNQLRELSRSLRQVPVVGRIIERSDPPRRKARLLAAGVMDPVLYAAQLGEETRPEADAVHHYVMRGYRSGMAVNVLLDNFVLKDNLPGTERPLVYDYLALGDWRIPVSHLWDPVEYLREHPDAAQHPGGPVGHLWARAQADPGSVTVPVRDAAGVRQLAWTDLYSEALSALAEWARARDDRRRRRPNSFFRKPDEKVPDWDKSRPQPLVSIVMATWNRSGGMRVAVESIRKQSWHAWELIIVDDGSWDDTVAVAEVLAARDSRIRVVQRAHEGVSAARNAGIAEARGEFVAFLDSDNEWQPDFLEKMVAAMDADGDEAAFATIKLVYEDREAYRQSEPTHDSLMLGNSIDLNTLVVRTPTLRATGGFDETLPRAVDFDLILRLREAHRIHHIPFIGAIYDNRDEAEDRISTTEPMGWNTFVRLRAQVPWDDLEARELLPGTSVVAIINRRDPNIAAKLRELVALSEDEDLSVLVAFVAPTREEWMAGATARLGRPHLGTRLFVERESYAFTVDRCLEDVDRQVTLILGPGALFDADSVRRLAAQVDPATPRAVQPTNVTPDGVLIGVGADVPKGGAVPEPILAGHPLSDAVALGEQVSVPLLHGHSFGIPTKDLIRVRGVDSLLYNQYELPSLALALARTGDYDFAVDTSVVWRHFANADTPRIDPLGNAKVIRQSSLGHASQAQTVYERIGQQVTHWRDVRTEGAVTRLEPVVVRPTVSASVEGRGVPRLRWALKIASPYGPRGEVWGDTHFGRSLARALERLGQEVVIDYHHAHDRASDYLDDVTLVIRGLDDYRPVTAGTSLLWIISHPDDVTRQEAAAFDHVFAASLSWSALTASRWQLPIEPLLQCTDPHLFHPRGIARSGDIVFVGNSRNVTRPAVVDPVRAGVPVKVYGGDWGAFIPAESVVAERVANEDVAPLYEGASVVLNDHWRDMRRDGFISNRLFDVVAAGGRVLSDDVDGVSELFDGAAATYSSSTDLVAKLRGSVDALFAADEELAAVGARIRAEHSFDARARRLLEVALAARGSDDAGVTR